MSIRVRFALLLLMVGQCFGAGAPLDGSKSTSIDIILMKHFVTVSNMNPGDSVTIGASGGKRMKVVEIFRQLREQLFYEVYQNPELRKRLVIIETGRFIIDYDRNQVNHEPWGDAADKAIVSLIVNICRELNKQGVLTTPTAEFIDAFTLEMKRFLGVKPVSENVMFDDIQAERYINQYRDSLSMSASRAYLSLKTYSIGLLNAVQQAVAVTKDVFDRQPAQQAGLQVNIVDALRLAVNLSQPVPVKKKESVVDRASKYDFVIEDQKTKQSFGIKEVKRIGKPVDRVAYLLSPQGDRPVYQYVFQRALGNQSAHAWTEHFSNKATQCLETPFAFTNNYTYPDQYDVWFGCPLAG